VRIRVEFRVSVAGGSQLIMVKLVLGLGVSKD